MESRRFNGTAHLIARKEAELDGWPEDMELLQWDRAFDSAEGIQSVGMPGSGACASMGPRI